MQEIVLKFTSVRQVLLVSNVVGTVRGGRTSLASHHATCPPPPPSLALDLWLECCWYCQWRPDESVASHMRHVLLLHKLMVACDRLILATNLYSRTQPQSPRLTAKS
jgi:hypothetical protein